ncbi:MAG: hypothetical protein Q7U98_18040 [Methylicorpusculum sp.]|uniref:hypothetical protein n=1 Tax=Methylicorpusculum sp. TaxID=2713644 RepID=UPI002725F594|nr:hypothetical protein [Methylicorpusculum sp.]MDO8941058.1 hypothetical protein [Methylicorpusculum sp.]MDP2202343.1 hypothetical protein [Methylicorpusculum sp.]
MNKVTIKAFIGWLDTAADEAIAVRRDEFLRALMAVTSREAKADLRLGLRLIDEELMARFEVFRLSHRPHEE